MSHGEHLCIKDLKKNAILGVNFGLDLRTPVPHFREDKLREDRAV